MNNETANFYLDNNTPPFLVLEENRFAHVALGRLSEGVPRDGTGVAFIYGPSGVGKSHLLRQFIRDTRRRQADAVTLHVTASQLAAEFAAALENAAVDEFRQLYCNLDVLICEDLQALERRYETQRQLVSFIDEILLTGGCVVLTCKHSPGALDHVLPRLVNRCHSGTCTPVRLPSRSSRVALLKHFAQTRQTLLSEDAVHLLADRLPVSPRELLAAVIQLLAAAHAANSSTISGCLVRSLLNADGKPRPLTISEISRTVAVFFGVRVSDLRSRTRLHRLTLPRQCAMYLSRELTTEPLTKIGSYFRRPNHSTVAHACARVRASLPEDPQLRQQLTRLCELLAPAAAPALTTTYGASKNR